jgi:sialidase-1
MLATLFLLSLMAGISVVEAALSQPSRTSAELAAVDLRNDRFVGAPSNYVEYDVFALGEAGYYCIKIPYQLTTAKGTLIAMAEARYLSCSDFTGTDLVFKRSTDNGTTWSPLMVLYSNTSIATNEANVIGNAVPIQLRDSPRILVPFSRNNFEMLQTWSDDDGLTWAAPVSIPGGIISGWQWVACGPPGGLQLQSGRLFLPCYHSNWPHWTDATQSRGHTLINDDPMGDPARWRVGAVASGIQWTNEAQAVELEPNHVLVASRGLLIWRIQYESFDGGETLQPPYYVNNLTEPLDGCEGSILYHRKYDLLFYSGTISLDPRRFNMTLWTSSDKGRTWALETVVNPGRTAYSSLVLMPDGDSVGLLYERSNSSDFVFLPTQISFVNVWPRPVPAPTQLEP